MPKVYPNKYNGYQEQFHRHSNCDGHSGMKGWKITITDRTEIVLEQRRRENYWQHILYKFIPNKLNEYFVDIPKL